MGRVALYLPEHLKQARFWVGAGDLIAGALTIFISAWLFNGAAGAYLFLACTIVVGVALQRYSISFVTAPHEEWYAAASVALLALPFAVPITAMLGQPWYSPLLAAPMWVALAGYAASRATALRRQPGPIVASTERFSDMRFLKQMRNQRAIIRVLDVTLASIAGIFALPLLAVISLLVAREDGTPIFFKQSRIGQDEREFSLFKVRTMKKESGEAWVVPGDDRITKIGRRLRKASLDELPQLVNVLKGEMSLVGPRPEMRAYAETFANELSQYANRHLVAPGITGWAQLYLPRNLAPTDAERVLSYDLFYVANYGVALYTFCLVKTACEISRHRAE